MPVDLGFSHHHLGGFNTISCHHSACVTITTSGLGVRLCLAKCISFGYRGRPIRSPGPCNSLSVPDADDSKAIGPYFSSPTTYHLLTESGTNAPVSGGFSGHQIQAEITTKVVQRSDSGAFSHGGRPIGYIDRVSFPSSCLDPVFDD